MEESQISFKSKLLKDLDSSPDTIKIQLSGAFESYIISYNDLKGGSTTGGASTTTVTACGATEHNFSEIENKIIDLPSVDEFKDTNLKVFEVVEKQYNQLSDNEKSTIDEFLHNKYKAILKLAEPMRKTTVSPVVIKTVPTANVTPVPKTGDPVAEGLLLTSSVTLAIISFGLYFFSRKKRED